MSESRPRPAVPARTFPELLAAEVRRAGSRPLVTFYDDARGERVELSVTTYANWVAKTAGLLADELGVERGATVLLDLPTHWLGPVWLGALWTLGATATDEAEQDADLVMCSPRSLDRHTGGPAPVVATALLPMAARFPGPLPDGVVDFGAVVWGQPDAFVPLDPPAGDDPAWRSAAGEVSQAALLGAALPAAGARLLTDLNPCSASGLAALVGPLAAGGGTVWVRDPRPERWEHLAAAERVDAVVRAGGEGPSAHPAGQPTRS